MNSKVIVLIPARYDSARFPGKLLKRIDSRTILNHVFNRVTECNLVSELAIVSDDTRILDEANLFGARTVVSQGEFICGSDRIFSALETFENYDLVLNVQADQPFISPKIIDELIRYMALNPSHEICSLRSSVRSTSISLNDVKVTVDDNSFALDFFREDPGDRVAFGHIGVYGFRSVIINQLKLLNPSSGELLHNLEQLRWLENNYKIQMVAIDNNPVSVNVPEDYTKLKEGL